MCYQSFRNQSALFTPKTISFFAKKVQFLPPKHASRCFLNEFSQQSWQESFDGDSFASQSRFHAFATSSANAFVRDKVLPVVFRFRTEHEVYTNEQVTIGRKVTVQYFKVLVKTVDEKQQQMKRNLLSFSETRSFSFSSLSLSFRATS